MPHTPGAHLQPVMAIRQIGVPLGGILPGLIVRPWRCVSGGWRMALAAEPLAVLVLALALEIPRGDGTRTGGLVSALFVGALAKPFRLWREKADIRWTSRASHIQACSSASFRSRTVHLTQSATRFGLVAVGLGARRRIWLSGAISRPLLGFIADRWATPTKLLAFTGLPCAFASGLRLRDGRLAWLACGVVRISPARALSGFYSASPMPSSRGIGGAQRTERPAWLHPPRCSWAFWFVPPLFGLVATGISPSFVALGLLVGAGGGASMIAPRR